MGTVFFPLIFNRAYRLRRLRLEWQQRFDRLEAYLKTLSKKEH